MILKGTTLNQPRTFQADVAVIGSGAGGGVVTKELQEHGLQVVLLEEGGYYTSRDFTQREEEMMPRLYWDAGMTGNRDFSVLVQYGRCAGGSTSHNIALCFRPEEAILARWREEYAVRDITMKDILPYLDRVEKHLGVNPIRQDQLNTNNLLFKKGADRLGYSGLIPNHNRINCLGSGFCEIGCSYDRLQHILITYLPKADQKGAQIVCDARVEKLVVERGRVKRLEGFFLDRKTQHRKQHFSVEAETFVLSAGAIHTPNLLQKSLIRGNYGRTLRLHPYIPVAAIFPHKVEAWKGIPQSYVVDEFASFKKDGYGGFLCITGFAHPAAFAAWMPGSGKRHRALMEKYPYFAACGAMVHDETKGKISLTREGRAVIDYFPEEKDKPHFLKGLKELSKILLAAGAEKVLLPYSSPVFIQSKKELGVVDQHGILPHEILIGSVHPQASCPMGENPNRSFVNSYGQSHTIPNLYIADTSIFCSSLGTPPQIPTMTFATRTAFYILKQHRKPTPF